MCMNSIRDSSVYIGPFANSFFRSSTTQTLDGSGLANLVKFILQKNSNFIDFLLSFYSMLLQASSTNADKLEDVKKFKDLYESLPKDLHICVCDVIEQLSLFKEGKQLLKEYNIYYKYCLEVINELVGLINSIKNSDNILNLYSGLGILKDLVINNIQYKQIDCYDPDEKLNEFNKLINLSSNICVKKTDILHGNDITGLYDLVITDIPENIKNIIYAKLCTKIKDLKIRGTKSEPLVIQLISQLLKKDGKAIIIVSNSFLFGDSKQHIETRKFIYENSSEIQVINLPNKKSILFWTKSSSPTNSTQISFKNSGKIFIANDEQVKTSEYSFYYYNYVFDLINKPKIVDSIEWVFENLIDIKPNSVQATFVVPVLYSYSNTNFSISLNPDKYDYVFVTKDENILKQEYLNYYLLDYLKNNIDIITKGKTKTLCLDKINKMLIEKKSIQEQNNIIDYIVTNEQINKMVQKQNINIKNIKSSLFNSFEFKFKNFDKLSSVATISNQTDGVDSIGIYKNSTLAGQVFKVNEPLKSDNIYFIVPKYNDITNEFLYNYLLEKQDQLVELAKINNTVSLSKKHIESFEIPKISLDEQNQINKSMDQIITLINSFYNIPSNINIFNLLSTSS